MMGTHDCSSDESPPKPDVEEERTGIGVDVVVELDDPCDRVSRREGPDDSAAPPMEDRSLVEAVVGQDGSRPDVERPLLSRIVSDRVAGRKIEVITCLRARLTHSGSKAYAISPNRADVVHPFAEMSIFCRSHEVSTLIES